MQDGSVLMHGGQTNYDTVMGRSDETFKLDVINRQWTRLETPGARPSARSCFGMASFGTNMVVFGGTTGALTSLWDCRCCLLNCRD
jgi:hypothetical protein